MRIKRIMPYIFKGTNLLPKPKRVTSYKKRPVLTDLKTTTRKGKNEYQKNYMRMIRKETRRNKKR